MVSGHISRRGWLKTAGAVSVAGLAGCTGGDGGDGGDTTTTTQSTTTTTSQQGGTVHFLNDRAVRGPWEAAVQEFNSGSDYTVDVTWLPQGTAVNEQIQKMEAAGNLPALIFETSADAYTETLAGKTVPLTDIVEGLGVKDTVNVDGDSYMVPVETTPLFLNYRSDVVEGEPRTWSEWRAEATRLQEQGEQYGYAVPSGRTNLATSHTTQILWNSGVNGYSGTGEDIEITLDQGDNRDRAVAAFEWLQEMNELGPNATGWEWPDIESALIQENIASATDTGLALLQIQSNRPDILPDIRPALPPVAEGQSPTQWWGYFEGMYCYEEAANTEGAKEFIEFFMGSDYYFEYLRQAAPNSYPTSLESVEDERYTSAEIFETVENALEYQEIVVNNWDSLASVLNTGDDNAPNNIAANAYSQQLSGQAAGQLLSGGLSPEETVDWLAEELRTLQSN